MICCYLLWSRACDSTAAAFKVSPLVFMCFVMVYLLLVNQVYSENRSEATEKKVVVNGVKETVVTHRGVDQASQVS